MYLNNVNIALTRGELIFKKKRKKKKNTGHNWLFLLLLFFFLLFLYQDLPEIYKYRKDKGVTIPLSINTHVKY